MALGTRIGIVAVFFDKRHIFILLRPPSPRFYFYDTVTMPYKVQNVRAATVQFGIELYHTVHASPFLSRTTPGQRRI